MQANYRYILRLNGFLFFTSEPMTEAAAEAQAASHIQGAITAEIFEDEDHDYGDYHPHGDPQI
jgi:hypothetical protein